MDNLTLVVTWAGTAHLSNSHDTLPDGPVNYITSCGRILEPKSVFKVDRYMGEHRCKRCGLPEDFDGVIEKLTRQRKIQEQEHQAEIAAARPRAEANAAKARQVIGEIMDLLGDRAEDIKERNTTTGGRLRFTVAGTSFELRSRLE